jgi:hypothetical protein
VCHSGPQREDCDLPAIRGGHVGGCDRAGVHRHRGLLDGHPAWPVPQCEYITGNVRR